MSASWQSCVPLHLHDAVAVGLRGAFDTAGVEGVEPVVGGASGASALRLMVKGEFFLLRVESVRSPLRNPHQYACMRTAAEAGVAPPVRYVDDQAGVAIMDYISSCPLQSYPGGSRGLAHALGTLASKLQSTVQFPVLADYRVVVRRLADRLQTFFAPGMLDPHLRVVERISGSLSWDACHACEQPQRSKSTQCVV